MDNNQDNTDQKPVRGYGKRPLWQWILIYVVIGAMVYFVIYYFSFGRNNTAPYSQTTTQPTQTQNNG
ncbi:MAG: hypothetical protein Q8P73_02015 [bacterium]|nr:hypothetical protein [bacterium]